jgi:hypothetical protein
MGVLLSLQTMDRAKLEMLNQRYEEQTLEWGMEFLKAASSGSTLAARYVALLQRFWNPPRAHDTTAGDGRENQAMARTGSTMEDPPMFTEDATWLSAGRQDESDGIRFQPTIDADFVDFDDLLMGTGLPRDFIAGQWLNVEALL